MLIRASYGDFSQCPGSHCRWKGLVSEYHLLPTPYVVVVAMIWVSRHTIY